jgi:hypothetical protein
VCPFERERIVRTTENHCFASYHYHDITNIGGPITSDSYTRRRARPGHSLRPSAPQLARKIAREANVDADTEEGWQSKRERNAYRKCEIGAALDFLRSSRQYVLRAARVFERPCSLPHSRSGLLRPLSVRLTLESRLVGTTTGVQFDLRMTPIQRRTGAKTAFAKTCSRPAGCLASSAAFSSHRILRYLR